MKIAKLVCSVGISGFLYKDLAAIKAGAEPDGLLLYKGDPVTPGFKRIIQPGKTVSVMLVLEDGSVGFGDCAEVILVGLAGRDGMFVPEEMLPILEGPIAERLEGRDMSRFRELAEEIDSLEIDGKRLHTAVRYGVTQALLDAAAHASRLTMAEIVAREYGSTLRTERLPILAGALRADWAQHDRMILKRADVLPHTPFLSVRDHVGFEGEKLVAYMERLAARLEEIKDPDYHPRIHIDLYGTMGELFDNDAEKIAEYLGRLERIIAPYDLLVESPVVASSRQGQIDIYRAIRKAMDERGIKAGLVIDEWANTLDDIKAFKAAGAIQNVQIKTPDMGGVNNTIEALIFCRENGIGACLGGTSNETDQSARVTAQLGIACGAEMISTKPGQGSDEGWMILVNEMERALALIRARAA
ncbi:methylaspartate ammonia-lyase [Aquamicrobium sp. LC103]|uniref:methylaspartate ammonia-lyase n=1 Tax=Aquamicrobium sp. LC103 TaxID=1120658 RepID=UPI00063EC2D5|nr:methylaspartate ammonia-lyase [Aquamicrobium sp. LC103]TKT74591.1 methylaspartate ammonia-lyase [Aquamicrobium sp. LC103]